MEQIEPGITHKFTFRVTEEKIVSALYPEAPEFQVMPKVLATGYFVGLFEWACIQAINPYIDWPNEQTVGTYVNVSHIAPTPPGGKITVSVKLLEVDRRRLVFEVKAHDDHELIGEGTHERFVIDREKFNAKVEAKRN